MKKKKAGKGSSALLVLVFLVGLSLLLYPTVSDYWNSLHASRAVTNYAQQVERLDREQYKELWRQAVRYNQTLLDRVNSFMLTDEQQKEYETLLNPSGTGVMGYLEIPNINLSLPIYHGASEAVLQVAVGHLEWTSLPVGGESTHCVLSGHRGLPSAKLFTNLDKLVEGDRFSIRVLNEVMSYEVDQILIVEPTEVDALQVEPGKDLCTLVTCTPYGINSHRLLVRGHRVPNTPEAAATRLTSDATQIEPMLVAPVAALPFLLLFLTLLLRRPRRQ